MQAETGIGGGMGVPVDAVRNRSGGLQTFAAICTSDHSADKATFRRNC